MKLDATKDQESMEKLLNEDVLFDARFEAGFNATKVLFREKSDLIQKIAKHYIICRQLEEIQSCKKGLELGGILNVLQQHKIDAVGQFTYKQDHLTTKELIDLFTITYSSLDTAKEAEEDIVYNFTNFLDHVQKNPMEVEVLDYESILAVGKEAVNYADEGKLKRVQIKLEDVLQFLTGSKFVGSLKGMKGEISFCHDCSAGRRVKVNTCGTSIIFPATTRYTDNYLFPKTLLMISLTHLALEFYNNPHFYSKHCFVVS
eukprot:gene14821-16361_t